MQVRPSRPSHSSGGHFYAWSRNSDGLRLADMKAEQTRSFELTCVAVDGCSPNFRRDLDEGVPPFVLTRSRLHGESRKCSRWLRRMTARPSYRLTVSATNKSGQTYLEFLPPLIIHNCLVCDLEFALCDQAGEERGAPRTVACSKQELVHGIGGGDQLQVRATPSWPLVPPYSPSTFC